MAAWLAEFPALPAASPVPIVAAWEVREMNILSRRAVALQALQFRRVAVALSDHRARPAFVEPRPSHRLVPALP
jgi:hypothetical protein